MNDKHFSLSVEKVENFCKEATEILTKINNLDGSGMYYWYIAEKLEECVKLIKDKKVVKAEEEFNFMIQNLKVGL